MIASAWRLWPCIVVIGAWLAPDAAPGQSKPHAPAEFAPIEARDWPMYNGDVLGTRHNRGETAIGPDNVGRLVEKWRFPDVGAVESIGVIHATPVVVNGYAYFGTATDPAFYKLTPAARVRWVYRNRDRPSGRIQPEPPRAGEPFRAIRFLSTAEGVVGSALVVDDTVYFGDLGGWFYALDRATGAERWKFNARLAGFPGAHPLNAFFASPIIADGKVIVAGGTLEQVVASAPGYRGCTGRGFVAALDARTGSVVWKYDVGPRPVPLDPPITIQDSWGKHTFYFGPATSCVWCTPSYDAETGTLFVGTDVNTAPRRPTEADPRLDTRESCAVIALNVHDGTERWVTQISAGNVWINAMCSYDAATGRYKDQAVGDTPKIYTIPLEGKPTKVVGAGCKNGGFYVMRADDGRIVARTPIYSGPPRYPLNPPPDPRMPALPSVLGGLQTGCATDGHSIFTNGIDALRLASQERRTASANPPTAGRVVALSLDTAQERWRHERPRVDSVGGPPPKTVYRNVGDPVASGIALANGVAYFTTVAGGKLVALDTATGSVLKEIDLGPVWCGPSIARGRVYAGSGNTLFNSSDFEAYFPKRYTGTLFSFGLPGADEVSRLGAGTE